MDTVKLHDEVNPAASVAVHITIEFPTGKHEPDGGLHTTEVPGQLSETPGAKLTVAQGAPNELPLTADGQVIEGASVSLTVTVNEHDAVLLEASNAVQVTVVVPIPKNPGGGLHAMPGFEQLSVALTS